MKTPFFTLLLTLALGGCVKPSHPVPSQPAAATAAGKHSLEEFRFDWPHTTVQDLEAEVGKPDRDIGSGIYILEYHLQDGSHVWVGSSDNSHIIYVRHGAASIGEGEVLYERR